MSDRCLINIDPRVFAVWVGKNQRCSHTQEPCQMWAHFTKVSFPWCHHDRDLGEYYVWPHFNIKTVSQSRYHDDVIKWKHFPRYWPFVRGIRRSPVNSPHKGQWCGALMFSLICAWINSSVNYRDAGGLRCHRAHYDISVMKISVIKLRWSWDCIIFIMLVKQHFYMEMVPRCLNI